LIINMDQTGVHLVPSARWTYEKVNSDSVAVIGAEDKRQITACIASSLDGELLPMQLIFEGKTDRSLPAATAAAIAARVDRTHSDNHWSSQQTMQRYIAQVIMPHAERSIQLHQLHADAKIILILDVWAVHKSEEFRRFLRTHHPRIHLVFVPPNCTSKLQVADVALQRPFKYGISSRFNQWAAEQIAAQIAAGSVTGVANLLKMGVLKPLVLQWCVESWNDLKERKQLILDGWAKCCTSLFNVNDPARRNEAVAAVAKRDLDLALLPDEDEQDACAAASSDESEDELDVSQMRTFGRQSGRARKPAASFGYQLNSASLAMTEDSDS